MRQGHQTAESRNLQASTPPLSCFKFSLALGLRDRARSEVEMAGNQIERGWGHDGHSDDDKGMKEDCAFLWPAWEDPILEILVWKEHH